MDSEQATSAPCPDCHGAGKTAGFACPGFRYHEMTCALCGGSGTADGERLEWRRIGTQLRGMRVRRDMTQREAAQRFQLDVVKLSQMEHGLLDPAPLADAWAAAQMERA